MIYFIQEEGTGNIKIGYSGSIKGVFERLRAFRTGNSKKCILLKVIRGNRNDETLLHNEYLNLKVNKGEAQGEWYLPGENLLTDIESFSSIPNFYNSLTDRKPDNIGRQLSFKQVGDFDKALNVSVIPFGIISKDLGGFHQIFEPHNVDYPENMGVFEYGYPTDKAELIINKYGVSVNIFDYGDRADWHISEIDYLIEVDLESWEIDDDFILRVIKSFRLIYIDIGARYQCYFQPKKFVSVVF